MYLSSNPRRVSTNAVRSFLTIAWTTAPMKSRTLCTVSATRCSEQPNLFQLYRWFIMLKCPLSPCVPIWVAVSHWGYWSRWTLTRMHIWRDGCCYEKIVMWVTSACKNWYGLFLIMLRESNVGYGNRLRMIWKVPLWTEIAEGRRDQCGVIVTTQ